MHRSTGCLIEHRGRGRPDRRAQERNGEAHQRTIARLSFGDAGDAGSIEHFERHDVRRVNLDGIGRELGLIRAPNDDPGDDESRARLEIVQVSDDSITIELESDLFFDLSKCGFGDALAFIRASARQCPLSRVAPEGQGSPGENERSIAVFVAHKRHRDRGAYEIVVDDFSTLEALHPLVHALAKAVAESDAHY